MTKTKQENEVIDGIGLRRNQNRTIKAYRLSVVCDENQTRQRQH